MVCCPGSHRPRNRHVPDNPARGGQRRSQGMLYAALCHGEKVKGQWVPAESLLLPGYVIAVTNDAVALYERLKNVRAFTRLLVSGEVFCPLDQDDRAWLEAFTNEGDRVIPMSKGFMEGDKVVVFSGPLKGREGCITSVNRRKSVACIELDMCGRRVKTRIGLGIVRKRRCPGESTAQQ